MRVVHPQFQTPSASDGSAEFGIVNAKGGKRRSSCFHIPNSAFVIRYSRRSRAFSLIKMVLLVTVLSCHKSTPTPPSEEPQATVLSAKPLLTETLTQRIPLSDDANPANRWLFVEKAKDNAPGGWAAGSFDREKNKLEIRTRDVRQFAIDVERIAIDWQRLVVISIDGKNSELRRRETTLLHFRLDDHGQWVVTEP